MKTTWKDLSIKEKIAILSAVVAFILGWAMSIGAFFVPPVGEVADSILWISILQLLLQRIKYITSAVICQRQNCLNTAAAVGSNPAPPPFLLQQYYCLTENCIRSSSNVPFSRDCRIRAARLR